MHLTGCQIPGHDPPANAGVHNQIDCEILDKKFGPVLERLLIQRVKYGVPGAIGSRAGALCNAFTKISRHASERTLVYFAFLGAREWHAIMLKLDYRGHCFAAHVLDCVLISQPVRTFNRIVHVPLPAIGPHVTKRSTHATLCCNRMASSREHLGNTGG